MSAVLVLSRGDDSAGLMRKIVVRVDDAEVARLGINETVEVPISPGRHHVVASMDWTRSPRVDVEIAGDERISLRTSLPWSGFWRMLTAPRSTLTLTRVSI